ncbi:r2r3-MYB transcription factor, putative [Entamoeba invadens IP1]|uniref:R2r3-MYB transcription factor, putative n=1 Tax=Entamoeba invadens IP1 TaxID=370355 RepID=A0A0A1U9Y5_ENTIV|nr:r2r3-MYB transcription factor, putative [Entamoeba invadens IP1]ELP88949.1 r2r3-MYB transcription factor, putative [Entamoeba invadens IP1]|eukprot:XP_004255720.1 r2r3-MYB transcription factor, putative [Entamoeba invadens IP1]
MSDQMGHMNASVSNSEPRNPTDQLSTLDSFDKGNKKKKFSHTWTEKEDEMLEEAVRCNGAMHWKVIADMIPGRSRKQCRERYCYHLDPKINKRMWSIQEDQLLVNLHKEVGNHWSYMKKYLPGRTANAIKIDSRRRLKATKNGLSVFTAVSTELYSVF